LLLWAHDWGPWHSYYSLMTYTLIDDRAGVKCEVRCARW